MVNNETITGPLLSRAEQRAFVLALAEVPMECWWWEVIWKCLPCPVAELVDSARRASIERREILLAAADLLRPRYTREEAAKAQQDAHHMYARAADAWSTTEDDEEASAADERVIRMITGEEP